MKNGFTLLELLVVIIILGILAAVAIPTYTRTAEKARAAEAVKILSFLREGQLSYFNINNSWRMSSDIVAYTGSSTGTEWESVLGVGFDSDLWQYAAPANGADTVSLSAQRAGSGPFAGTFVNMTAGSSGATTWEGDHPGTPKN